MFIQEYFVKFSHH